MGNEFSSDKAKWQWDYAYNQYVKENNVSNRELTFEEEEEEEEIWALASGHIVYFFTWVIKRDMYNKEDDWYNQSDINKIKDEIMNTFELFKSSNDLVLSSEDLNDELIGFMNDYYESGDYYNDYYEFLEEVIHTEKLYVKFDYEIYHKLEPIIDKAYEKYLNR